MHYYIKCEIQYSAVCARREEKKIAAVIAVETRVPRHRRETHAHRRETHAHQYRPTATINGAILASRGQVAAELGQFENWSCKCAEHDRPESDSE